MPQLFIGETLTQIVIWQFVICQGQLHTEIKLIKAVNCDMVGLRWLMKNLTLRYQYPMTYMNAQFEIIEDIKIFNALHLHVERCNDQGYDCEDFQSWRIDHLCQMLAWRNQIWSNLVARIHPTFRCPVKKMKYEVRNAAMDVEVMMKWYPDMAKYRWKGLVKIINERGVVLYCGNFEFSLHQFRTQNSFDKKPSKKPRNV